METQVVSGDTGQSAVLKTYVSDADLQRTIDAEPPTTCAEERQNQQR